MSNWEDTVMSRMQIEEIKYLDVVCEPDTKGLSPSNRRIFQDRAIVKAQAKISFKAGMMKVVEWIQSRHLLSNDETDAVKEWLAFLKESGIERPEGVKR